MKAAASTYRQVTKTTASSPPLNYYNKQQFVNKYTIYIELFIYFDSQADWQEVFSLYIPPRLIRIWCNSWFIARSRMIENKFEGCYSPF